MNLDEVHAATDTCIGEHSTRSLTLLFIGLEHTIIKICDNVAGGLPDS
jgi:hypothetical protein